MSKKFKAVKKATVTTEAMPVATEATVTAAPVVATPAPVETGRTIVEIAKSLKITPQNARRLARQHADALGHAGKGARWLLNADQEKAFIALGTAPKAKPAVAA